MAQPVLIDIGPLRPTLPRQKSQSPSRSPRRLHRAPAPADVPLRDITPRSAYRAIVSSFGTGADVGREEEEGLMQSLVQASGVEREFGVKVAKSAIALKEWCEEVEGWEWSGGFEVRGFEDGMPESEASFAKDEGRSGVSGDGGGERGNVYFNMVKKETIAREGWVGSITAEQVSMYERRLEEVMDGLDDLDMEEQKARVLETHLQQRSPSSAGNSVDMPAVTEYVHLDGLTALVTSTILRALPDYNYLTSLLDTWAARIIVLKRIPFFYQELEDAQKSLDSAWIAIGFRLERSAGLRRPRTIKLGNHGMFRHSFEQIHTGLEEKMATLGKSIDTMLDVLEAREDTLPDEWVDTVEELELDYSNWTVEAQKKVLLYEHRLDVHTPSSSSPTSPKSSGTWTGGSKQLLANAANAATFAITGRTISMPAFRKEAGEIIEEENASEEEHGPKQGKDPFIDSLRNRTTSSSFGSIRGSSTPAAESVSLSARKGRLSASGDSLTSSDHIVQDQGGGEKPNPFEVLPGPENMTRSRSDDFQSQVGLGISRVDTMRHFTSIEDASTPMRDPGQSFHPVQATLVKTSGSRQSPRMSPATADTHRPLAFRRSTDDELARQVENLLITLPARANFTTTEYSQQYQQPILSKLDGDSSTRLLELCLPGRQSPLRMFVRLLGEQGDRVMVRVGGGWADLGEYLRSYAAHHSRAFTPEAKPPGAWYSPIPSPTTSPTTLPNFPTPPTFHSNVPPVRPIRSMSSSYNRIPSPRSAAEERFGTYPRGLVGSVVADMDGWGEEK